MKQLMLLAFAAFAFSLPARSQNSVKQAPPGFDSLHADIAHGKIDTITYNSKTVGTKRRA